MIQLDDSLLEYALHDLLGKLEPTAGMAVPFETLRSLWRTTGLRHCDLLPAIDILVENGSLTIHSSDLKSPYVEVTTAGSERTLEIVSMVSTTMADQVARSILKTVRDRVVSNALQPRSYTDRRRSSRARDRMQLRVNQRAG